MIYLYVHRYTILYVKNLQDYNMLLIDDAVDAHNVVIVAVFIVDNADDEHDDFRTDDAMLLVVYKYQMLHLSSCKLPTI